MDAPLSRYATHISRAIAYVFAATLATLFMGRRKGGPPSRRTFEHMSPRALHQGLRLCVAICLSVLVGTSTRRT